MGLAPMAVALEWQGKVVGSELVKEGLKRCKEMGSAAVVVLGHPTYYPRFGFVPASRFGINSEYDAPDDAFMALELVAESLEGKTGLVRFHKVFQEV
jgi:putative acetyltransferase